MRSTTVPDGPAGPAGPAGRAGPVPDRPLRVAVHQPGYHRHLYYFAKMAAADVFVSLDTVQFVRREWQNRQRFVVGGHERRRERWLSVPVNGGREPIRDKRITDLREVRNHWATIRQAYRRTPYLRSYEDEFAELYSRDWDRLIDLCEAVILLVRRELGITTPWLSATDLLNDGQYGQYGRYRRGALLAELALRAASRTGTSASGVEYVACATPMRPDHYLLGAAGDGTDATERQIIEGHGVGISTFAYREPVYRQAQFDAGTAFVTQLSACDLLFNHGPQSRRILLGRGAPVHQPLPHPATQAAVPS